MLSHNETTTAKFCTSYRLISRNFCSIKGMRSAPENRKQSIVKKLALIVAVLSLVVMATVGVTFAQYVNTQNQNIIYGQTPQGYAGNSGCLWLLLLPNSTARPLPLQNRYGNDGTPLV